MAVGFCWFSLFSYLPILPGYARAMGASYELIGMIMGAYGLTQILFRFPLGIISDRLGKRKIFVIIGLILCVISSIGMFFSTNPHWLLVFRAVSGIAATTWVVHTILFAASYATSESGRAMGIVNSISNMGQMLATLTGGLVAYMWGDSHAFLLGAVGGAIGLVFSFGIAEQNRNTRETLTLAGLIELGRDRHLVLVSALAFLLQIIVYSTIYGFIPLAAKKIGATNIDLGLLPTLFMLPGIFASLASGVLFTRWFGSKNTIIAGFVIMSTSVLVIPSIQNLTLLYISQIAGGFGQGMTFPLLLELGIKHVDHGKRATAMGYLQAMYGIGMFLGPVIVGVLSDRFGLDWGFWTIGIIGLFGIIITGQLFSLPDKKQR